MTGWCQGKRKRAGNAEFPPYCLPVEDVIAFGYPRPAPSFRQRAIPSSSLNKTLHPENRSASFLFDEKSA
jgi:hypothetical protein